MQTFELATYAAKRPQKPDSFDGIVGSHMKDTTSHGLPHVASAAGSELFTLVENK
jgi:hypothetical protein